MLWLILLVSIAPIWSPARADEAEDKAVAFVEKLKGKVIRDEKAPGNPVVGVYLPFFAPIQDAGLKELAALKNLNCLTLCGTKVTDVGLKELVPLKNLTKLVLFQTMVTDAGLKELAALENLITLDLSCSKVTAPG
jgi:hypothetical protein